MADNPNAYDLVISDLKRQRAEIDAMIAKLQTMSGGQSIPSTDVPSASPTERDTPAVPRDENNPYLGMRVADATVALLRKTRRSMSPVEIVHALEAGGLLLSGSNKPASVGTILTRRQNRNGDLVRPKRGQWGLKEWYPGRNFGKSDGSDKNNMKEADVLSQATGTTVPERPSEPSQSAPPMSDDSP